MDRHGDRHRDRQPGDRLVAIFAASAAYGWVKSITKHVFMVYI